MRDWLAGVLHPHSHDAADSVDEALESNVRGIRAVKIGLVVLGITAVAQGVLVVLTGSVALLSDTIHNASDALTALPLWVAFTLARRGPSRRYTYGYGRAEDLAGVFIVAMIALSAVVAGWESARRLVDPPSLDHVWVVAAAGLIGFAGNELVAGYRIRVGRDIGSAALVADGVHARADGFTSLAVVVGALGVLAGFPLADPIIGILISVAILAVLRGAARDVWHRLMDGVDVELVDAAERVLARTPGVLTVDRVQLRWIGHRLHGEATVTVDPAVDLGTAGHIGATAEAELRTGVRRLSEATVRVVPPRGR